MEGLTRHTERWSGFRLEPRHSGFIPGLFPLFQVPLRKCPAGSTRPSETLAWLFMGGPKQSPRPGLSNHVPTLLLCKLLGQHGQGPTQPCSQTQPLHRSRTQPQGLLLTSHSNHPRTESPGSICAWCLPLLGGCCHVLLVLSSSTGRHNYHQLSSCPSTEPINNMFCDVSHLPIDPSQAHASPCSPAASGAYGRIHSSSCHLGREALPLY